PSISATSSFGTVRGLTTACELPLSEPPFPFLATFLATFLAEPPLPPPASPPPVDVSRHSPSEPRPAFRQAELELAGKRATESVDRAPRSMRVRETASPFILGRTAIVGVLGAVGLMVGTREPTLRLGVRMMLCAWTAEAANASNGNSAADRIKARRRFFIRQFKPS